MFEEIGDGAEIMDINGREVSVRAYCSWFNFKGGDQQKAVSVLSGGERNRLLLAKVCVRGQAAQHSLRCVDAALALCLLQMATRHDASRRRMHCAGPQAKRQLAVARCDGSTRLRLLCLT